MPRIPFFRSTRTTQQQQQQQQQQRGLSLIELLMFMVVIGIALAALLGVFVQATRSSADPQITRQALAIAESLMQEVQLMAFTFCDPDDANVDTATSSAVNAAGCASSAESIGPEAGESRYSAGAQFDNVNDYNGFSMTGIRDISNTAVTGLSNYNASISVANAALGSIPAGGDALLITVTVTGPGSSSVSLQGYRTRHAPNAAL